MTISTLGTKVEAPNKVIVRLADGEYQFSRSISPFDMLAGADPREYVMVQDSFNINNDVANYTANSAISMAQKFDGLNYHDAHVKTLKSGLTVPTPARFMPHLRNVNNALNKKGVLYDACGNLIEGNRLKQYANIVNNNSWVWLNASFPKGRGFLGLDLATITGLNDKNEPVISNVPLEDCLEKDCWADLESLNAQGFPTKKASINKYEPGKTIYFYKPRKDAVARFDAGSSRADLDCGRGPSGRSDSLGVFTSTEGASVSQK